MTAEMWETEGTQLVTNEFVVLTGVLQTHFSTLIRRQNQFDEHDEQRMWSAYKRTGRRSVPFPTPIMLKTVMIPKRPAIDQRRLRFQAYVHRKLSEMHMSKGNRSLSFFGFRFLIPIPKE